MSDQKKNYLIVDGRSGIGRAVLDRLMDSDCHIWCASREQPDDLDQHRVTFVPLDVTSNDFDSLTGALPDMLHGVVYCPGSMTLKPFQTLKDDDFRKDFELNVLGAVKVLRACQPKLKAAGSASVVLFSTVAAQTGMSFHASIAAAKSAVEGLARSLAAEWARQNIRVNVIAPSLTDTPLAQPLLANEKQRTAAMERHPLKRIGDPNDLTAAVTYLPGEESGWMSGQVLHIVGGLSSLRPL